MYFLFSAIYGAAADAGVVSFEFLILFAMEREEPLNDDTFSTELLADELRNDGKGCVEVEFDAIPILILPNAELVYIIEQEMTTIIAVITNFRNNLVPCFILNVSCSFVIVTY